ncbi:alpha-2-macroglobulin family protein [Desulfobulbus rhabdoformis]|uniref:alpha-2-macroglobulin family protein n=1 Tax=Desulfobulbus rhabdoformis TaxID=34032 RepID=UPI0019649C69|nr:alpha-2-macroglobulin [Desulfobulbus rhabdoformis]MBM9614074.1 alpha-2-macroglobulin family protein [Desulfobulbus rhabdoformis]
MKKHAILSPFKAALRGIAALLSPLVGQLSWTPPPWSRWLAAHPALSFSLLLILAGGSLTGWYGYTWYSQRPQPQTVEYALESPALTDYASSPVKVHPLRVRFGQSVAPIDIIGKEVLQGIRLEPSLKGSWKWEDDQTLSFIPAQDWPIAQTFRLSFSKDALFTPGVLLGAYASNFQTPPFSATVESAKIQQNPTKPAEKKLFATIRFSHAVNPATVAQNLRLELGKGLAYRDPHQQKIGLNITKNGLKLHLQSAPLALPLENASIALQLDSKISALNSPAGLEKPIETKVTVPGRYQLTFSRIKLRYINNQQGEPQQVLSVESSFPITDAVAASHVHAWLLPAKKRPYHLSQVQEKDLHQSLSLQLLPSEHPANTLHNFSLQVPVERQLLIKIDDTIEAEGGYQMKQPLVALVGTGKYPQVVKLLGDGALLSLHGDKQVGFLAQGVPGVQVEIARLLPRQLHHLVDQNYGRFAQPKIYGESFDRLVEREIYTRVFAETDPNKPIYDSVNIGEYLRTDGGRQGVFVLKITPYDPRFPRKSYSDYVSRSRPIDRRLLVVTDLGIISKKTQDGGQEVFVQSLSTGFPVAQAQVQIIGRNGLKVAQGYTDAQGHVRFEQLRNLQREKEPIMVLVQANRDMSFLPLNRAEHQLDFSRFDVGGKGNQSSPNQITASLFTDRGLYRPGETAHIGYILRAADWSRSLDALPVTIRITDPRGVVVFNQKRTATPSGLDSIDFTPGPNSPAGLYSASIYLVKNNRRAGFINSTDFLVRAFEPERMKVKLALTEKPVQGWVHPEQVIPRVTARHLFGANAVGRRVQSLMELSPFFPKFPQYPAYRFHLAGNLKAGVQETLPPLYTDAQGQVQLEPDLNRFTAAAYRLRLTSRVFEAKGGRNVLATADALIGTMPYMIGVRELGSLTYITRGGKRECALLALNPELEPTNVEKIQLSLVEYRHVSVLVKQESGALQYESRRKKYVRSTQEISLPASGLTISLPTIEPGDFGYELHNAQGALLNTISWTVAGAGNLSRSLERNAELQITLDKATYKPGETVKISLRAPYTGSGLITVERDKVYAHTWFTTETTSSVQTITLPQGLEGNGYINVQFLRNPNSDEIFMSPLSYGVAPFRLSLAARRLPLQLKAQANIEPGQELAIDLGSSEAAKAVVFAVDEGILQVAHYKTPDPLNDFFAKRRLDVRTAQILDLVLPEYNRLLRSSAPGGGDEESLGARTNPFKRKQQKPAVYWSGLVDISPGKRLFHYRVPDGFNGKLRIIALAVTPERVGVASTFTEVRGPWVLSPNVPAFVAPGDRFTVSIGAFSNVAKTSTLHLSLETGKGVKLLGENPQELTIAPAREQVVQFELEARPQLGSTDLTFIGRSVAGDSRIRQAISIRPASPYRVALRAGSFQEAGFSLRPKRELVQEYGQVILDYGRSPLVWIQGLSNYLKHYPHECTEQLLSKTMPALISATPEELAQADFAPLAQAFSLLRQRRHGSGGFGQWASNLVVQPDISVYAADFLIEAADHGFAVPQDLQNQSIRYLERVSQNKAEGLNELRTRARAIYLLTRLGRVSTAQLSATIEQLEKHHQKTWQTDLVAAYLGASQMLMQQKTAGEKLLGKVQWATTSSAESISYGRFENSLTHDAELLTLLSRHGLTRLIPDGLIEELGRRISANQYHSFAAALLIRGFWTYAQEQAKGTNELSATLLTKTQKESAKIEDAEDIPLDWASIVLRQPKAGPSVFYQLTESGFDRVPPTTESTQGIEIRREYLDDQGNTVTRFVQGQEYNARLRLRATTEHGLNEIAIVDLLPGGVEPVQHTGASNREEGEATRREEHWPPSFVDTRDDRILLYGSLGPKVVTYEYRIRATNIGVFQVPSPYAEAMYDQRIQGRGKVGEITIVAP